jgi:hypothetical protein
MHPIIEALGLKELPAPETELLQKLFKDHLICDRAQQLMVEFFGPAAVRQLHPVERAALLKRISPAPKPQGRAAWTLATVMTSGQPYVKAECAACHQSVNFVRPEPRSWVVRERVNGEPQARQVSGITEAEAKQARALRWTHCGHTDKAPHEIALLWEQDLQKLVAR